MNTFSHQSTLRKTKAWRLRSTFVFQTQRHLCLKDRQNVQKHFSRLNMFDLGNNLLNTKSLSLRSTHWQHFLKHKVFVFEEQKLLVRARLIEVCTCRLL